LYSGFNRSVSFFGNLRQGTKRLEARQLQQVQIDIGATKGNRRAKETINRNQTIIIMALLRQATLDRANRKKDKSVSITFITDLEQSTDEFMEMDKLVGNHGIIYFSERSILTQQEMDELDKANIESEGKTKSQRLRNVLYRLWEQGDKAKTFDVYYCDWMDKVIEKMKSKLDEG